MYLPPIEKKIKQGIHVFQIIAGVLTNTKSNNKLKTTFLVLRTSYTILTTKNTQQTDYRQRTKIIEINRLLFR